MNELLLKWLNEELRLSRTVTNFTTDFSNGFLFGEIISRYGKQPDFVQFIDRNDERSKFANFKRLNGTLRTFDIKYNPLIASCIIKGDQEVILNLLYKLRGFLGKPPRNYLELPTINKSQSPGKLSPVKTYINSEKLLKIQSELSNSPKIQSVKSTPKKLTMSLQLNKVGSLKSSSLDLVNPHLDSNRSNHSTERKTYKFQVKGSGRSVAKKEDWQKEIRESRRAKEDKRIVELLQKVSEGKIFVPQKKKQFRIRLRERERNEVYSSLDAFDKRLGRDTEEDFYGLGKYAVKEEHPELFYSQLYLPELVKKSHDNNLYSIS